VISESTKVLIVDDDLADTYLLHDMLQKFGVQSIQSLVTGEEAVKYIVGLPPFQGRQLPDVIFIDLKMKGLDGFQLIASIKSNPLSSDIPLIVFSGSKDSFDRNRAMALGAKAYYQKTSEADKLKAMVESVLTVDE
jgi:CheY-like chemotaxis protein